jgi:hypothetical protein
MMISEVIMRLQTILTEHGDVEAWLEVDDEIMEAQCVYLSSEHDPPRVLMPDRQDAGGNQEPGEGGAVMPLHI